MAFPSIPWQVTLTRRECFDILPDGCQDVILISHPGRAPVVLVTERDAVRRQVWRDEGEILTGLRLAPGRRPDSRIFPDLQGCTGPDELLERVENGCDRPSARLDEALLALAEAEKGPEQAARLLGVSTRSLRRLVSDETGWSPVRWHGLARIRHAAGLITGSAAIGSSDNGGFPDPWTLSGASSLAEIAFQCGFSDQSHLSRECRRWFALSPGQLRQRRDLAQLLRSGGYDRPNSGSSSFCSEGANYGQESPAASFRWNCSKSGAGGISL